MTMYERRAQARREALSGIVSDVTPDVRAALADVGSEMGRAMVAELRDVAEDLAIARMTFKAGLVLGAAVALALLLLAAGVGRGPLESPL